MKWKGREGKLRTCVYRLCLCDICSISLCLDDVSLTGDMELNEREQIVFRKDLVEKRADDIIEMEVGRFPGRREQKLKAPSPHGVNQAERVMRLMETDLDEVVEAGVDEGVDGSVEGVGEVGFQHDLVEMKVGDVIEMEMDGFPGRNEEKSRDSSLHWVSQAKAVMRLMETDLDEGVVDADMAVGVDESVEGVGEVIEASDETVQLVDKPVELSVEQSKCEERPSGTDKIERTKGMKKGRALRFLARIGKRLRPRW